jgi:hypothetical protein
MHAQVENVLLKTIVERVQLIHKPGIPYVLLIGDAQLQIKTLVLTSCLRQKCLQVRLQSSVTLCACVVYDIGFHVGWGKALDQLGAHMKQHPR